MYNGKTILGIILARGGSKGLPGKNVKQLGTKPLLAWTIDTALESNIFDRLLLSTDCEEIRKVGIEHGADAPFLRPAELAEDNTNSLDAIRHALTYLENENETYDLVVLLQPTSPFRSADDIIGTVSLYLNEKNTDTAVSVSENAKSPYWSYLRNDDGDLENLLPPQETGWRRQNLPVTYSLNGAVYCTTWSHLTDGKNFTDGKTAGYIMPSIRSVDIDTPLDFLICEAILSSKLSLE